MKRYDYIDALRGIAVLGVLVAHTSLYGSNHNPVWFQKLTEIDVGPRGVQLFYIVSAFTLCLSFSNRKKIEQHPVRNFYIRRFFRIAPLFYIAVLYYLWQNNYWHGNPDHFSLANILTTFTFTNGVSSVWMNNIVFGGWSIAIEMTYYLLFPLLFYLLKDFRRSLIITICMMLGAQLLRLYLLSLPFIRTTPDIQTYTFQFFPSQLPVFLTGMAIFLFMTTKHAIKMNKKNIFLVIVLLVILLILQVVFKFKVIAGHYVYGIFFALLLYFLSKFPLKILVNPVMVFLGKISFGVYLTHVAVLYWLSCAKVVDLYPSNPLINYTLRLLLLLVCSSAVSAILYYTIERSGQLLGKKIIRHFEKVPAENINRELKTW